MKNEKWVAEGIDRFHAECGRYWKVRYIRAVGLLSMMEQHSLETVLQAIDRVDADKGEAKRHNKFMLKTLADVLLLPNTKAELKKLKRLYSQLQEGTLS